MSVEPLLDVQKLSKRFPGVLAVDQVSLSLGRGEVLAVIGENGAGKSTLMKILAGVQTADAGDLRVDGQKCHFESTREAMDHGIVLIHQELNLCDNLNIGQNIFLGREPRTAGIINRREINRRSNEFLELVGLDISPTTVVGSLTIGKQQMVEIAKALSVNARVLIMDEPTSSLSAKESEALFRLIDQLRSQGVSIIYISHRLAEVKRLADRVVVLRDGKNAGELVGDEIQHDAMVQRMVGRDVSQFYSRQRHPTGDVVFKTEKIRTFAWPQHELSFEIRAGEIVGLAGLVGAGRTEMLQSLFGITPLIAGQCRLEGKPVQLNSPSQAIDHGICLVPEDRKQHGLIVDFSVANNIGLPNLKPNQRGPGFANFAKQQQSSVEMCDLLDIKTPSIGQLIKFLSGGNQQKVVIGKWLAQDPKILLLDEPTRGIDIGAKEQIYKLMEQLASESMAILFASSEMEEILGLADRVIVLHEGQITGVLEHQQLSEQSVMQLATGTASPLSTKA
ncbi:MAG: sugar ABC transporter ATP-binding protein [Planctomycetota bacterium]|nr:sugar ABC transporter ATP-binding protein [Planctomycetota bacterium]